MELEFLTGTIDGQEATNIEITVSNNYIEAVGTSITGTLLVNVVDFSHGNMGVTRGSDNVHTINIWSEDSWEDASLLGTTGGIIVDVPGFWEEALKVYEAINDLVEYNPYYWEDH